MRSPLWFVVAGVIAIAGFVAAGLYLWPRLGSIDAGMIRVVVPGDATLDLGKAGTYTIFHEKQSVVDGRFYASDSVSGLRVDVIAEATGAPVRLEPATSTSYSMGSRQGTSIFAFTVEQPGRYRLTTNLAGGQAVLAIGQGMLGTMFALVGGTIAIAFAGLALAGIIVALAIWQRMKAKTA
jgi:threonine dehydrogenase-like Zn-dependent dehydrogenase